MLYEFLNTFGETLGFDMDSLPSLDSLQKALLYDTEAEEELLSIMTHLLVCAIEDPGIPHPNRHTTLLGQTLKQADITTTNVSEILRIYLQANGLGDVKLTTSVSPGDCQDSEAFAMSEWLKRKPFLSLSPTQKAAILGFLVNELLQNKAVIGQIDGAIEGQNTARRDRWVVDSKIKKLKTLHSKKARLVKEDEEKKIEEAEDEEDEADEEVDDEDETLPVDELKKKVERLSRQSAQMLTQLALSDLQLRALNLGQDRYRRRLWVLPHAGGVYLEGMESGEANAGELGTWDGKPVPPIGEFVNEELKEEDDKEESDDESKVEPVKEERDVKMEVDDELPKQIEEQTEERDEQRELVVKKEEVDDEEVKKDVKEEAKDEVELPSLWFSLIPRNPCDGRSVIKSVTSEPCDLAEEASGEKTESELKEDPDKVEMQPIPEGNRPLRLLLIAVG